MERSVNGGRPSIRTGDKPPQSHKPFFGGAGHKNRVHLGVFLEGDSRRLMLGSRQMLALEFLQILKLETVNRS